MREFLGKRKGFKNPNQLKNLIIRIKLKRKKEKIPFLFDLIKILILKDKIFYLI